MSSTSPLRPIIYFFQSSSSFPSFPSNFIKSSSRSSRVFFYIGFLQSHSAPLIDIRISDLSDLLQRSDTAAIPPAETLSCTTRVSGLCSGLWSLPTAPQPIHPSSHHPPQTSPREKPQPPFAIGSRSANHLIESPCGKGWRSCRIWVIVVFFWYVHSPRAGGTSAIPRRDHGKASAPRRLSPLLEADNRRRQLQLLLAIASSCAVFASSLLGPSSPQPPRRPSHSLIQALC